MANSVEKAFEIAKIYVRQSEDAYNSFLRDGNDEDMKYAWQTAAAARRQCEHLHELLFKIGTTTYGITE